MNDEPKSKPGIIPESLGENSVYRTEKSGKPKPGVICIEGSEDYEKAEVLTLSGRMDLDEPDDNEPFLPEKSNKKHLPLYIAITSLVILVVATLIGDVLSRYYKLASMNNILGFAFLSLILVLTVTVIYMIVRMIKDYMSINANYKLQQLAVQYENTGDAQAAIKVISTVLDAYKDSDDNAVRDGVKEINERMDRTMDPDDLLDELRSGILQPIDSDAMRVIIRAALQTGLGTAISPVAVVDITLVAWRNVKMIRDIAHLYGYRPGLTGTLRLTKRVLYTMAFAGISQLAMDAGMQALGGGLLGRVSAALAQGLSTGFLTVRAGVATQACCRPVPFTKGEVRHAILNFFRQFKKAFKGKIPEQDDSEEEKQKNSEE